MKKVVLACVLAALSLSSMAQTPEHGHYEVTFLKDGQQLFTGGTSLNTPVPFMFRDGNEVGEVTCTVAGGMKSMKSEQKFIGRTVQIARRVDDPRRADVTVEDSHLLNMEKVSAGDCATLTAKTDGLSRTELAVQLPMGNETVNVPVDGGRYMVKITHRID